MKICCTIDFRAFFLKPHSMCKKTRVARRLEGIWLLKELSHYDYTKISMFLIGEIMKIKIFINPSHNVPRQSGNVYATPGPPYDSLGHVFRWGQAKLGSSVSWEVIENVQKSNENQ